MEDKKLYFIVGAQRSGTTLLSKLLNNHPDIHCMPEANFFIFFLHAFKDKRSFSGSDIELIFEQIYLYSLYHPWVGWEFDLEKTREEFYRDFTEKQISYVELCKAIYEKFKVEGVGKENASILLDKNPIYSLFTEKIKSSIPDAKFILMIRDYRAHVLSRKQSVDFESPNIAFNALHWKLLNKIARKFQEENPDRVLAVKYEDLIQNKKNELNKICSFLNISADEDIFENSVKYKADTAGFDIPQNFKKRLDKKYTDLDKPINTDRMDSWKTELTKNEILLCDAICGNFAKPLGYKTHFEQGFLSERTIKLKHFPALLAAYLEIKKELIVY